MYPTDTITSLTPNNSTSNITGEGILWQIAGSIIVLSVLANTLLNTSIIIVFVQQPRLTAITGRIIILNMAVSDIVRGFSCDLATAICLSTRATESDDHLYITNVLGHYQSVSCPAFYITMLYFIAGLSLSRLIQLRGPSVLVRNHRTFQLLFCGMVWATVPVMCTVNYMVPLASVEIGSTLIYTWRLHTAQDITLWAVMILLGVIVPCSIIGITYFKLSRTVENNVSDRDSQEISTAALYIFVSGLVLVCPMVFTLSLAPIVDVPNVISVISFIMSSLNGINNAVILVYVCKQYRKQLLRYIPGLRNRIIAARQNNQQLAVL